MGEYIGVEVSPVADRLREESVEGEEGRPTANPPLPAVVGSKTVESTLTPQPHRWPSEGRGDLELPQGLSRESLLFLEACRLTVILLPHLD